MFGNFILGETNYMEREKEIFSRINAINNIHPPLWAL